MRTGVHGGISDQEYHADRTSLSASGAKLLLPPSCPAKFKQNMDHPPKPKPEYTFGHAAHRLVLGKGAEIVEVDAPDWRSKAAREIRDQACNGVAPMLTHELSAARAMADAVKSHPVAGPLFTGGHAEASLVAVDPKTGVKLRSRPDYMRPRGNRLVLTDLKTSTTADRDSFARKAFGFKYHLQAAFYTRVATLLKLDSDPAFIFVVVEKEPPHLVSIVEWDVPSMAEGHRLMAEAIRIYAECTEANTWPGYPTEIQPISLPLWAIDDEMEFSA
jgi:hypothetical protein